MKHIELAARIFIGLVLIAVFTLIWIYLGNIVIYVLLAALLGLIGRPFVRSLCNIKIGKYHLPRPLAAIFTLLMFYLVLVLLSMIFIPYVFSPLSQLADIDVDALVQYLDGPYHQLRTFLMQYGIIPQNTPYSPTQFIVENIKKALDFEKAGSVVRSLFGVLGNVANIITGLFSVTFISYFFMVDEKMSYHILMTIVPSQYEKRTKKVLNTSSYFLSRYLKGLVIQNIIFTFLITTAMWLLGVDNAILIGVVGGFSNIIPYVGPIIGGFFALFITITANVGIDFFQILLPLLLKISASFIVVQFIDNWLVQPYIFSNSVEAHPLEIFIVILVAGTLGGVGGMVLAIPVYTILRVVGMEFLSQNKIVQSLTQNIEHVEQEPASKIPSSKKQ